jgi:hypothetical protein
MEREQPLRERDTAYGQRVSGRSAPTVGRSRAIEVARGESAITVRTADWEVVHDLKSCGSIASIRLAAQAEGNLLAEPMRAYVDDAETLHSPARHVRVRGSRDGAAEVTVDGMLQASLGERPAIAIRLHFLHTVDYIRATVTLTAREPTPCSVVGVCTTKLPDRLTEFVAGPSPWTNRTPLYGELLGPMEDQIWGKIRFDGTPSFEESWVPFDLALYQPGREGLQVRPGSAWHEWNEGLGPEAGHGRYGITGLERHRGTQLTMEPYHGPGHPITLHGRYRFSYYIGIPKASSGTAKAYRAVAIDSHPFPSDQDIKEWAHRGVELLRLQDEYDWGSTDVWWRDWTYPPYDAGGMRELERVIATAHRYGLRVIPYLSMYECYPTARAFRHLRQWRRLMKSGGHEQFSGPGAMAVFGALLCPDSGWTRYAGRYMRMLLRRHAFDGLYFDWTTNVPCYNPLHATGVHSGIDGIYALFREARRVVGRSGIIESHVQGQAMDIIATNCSDQIVTLEERQRESVYSIDDMPRSIRFMGSRAVSIVPNILYPKNGDLDPRLRLKEGLSRFVVMGAIPYSYRRWEDRWGYASAEEARNDPEGLYALFDAMKPFDFSRYRLRDCHGSPVAVSHPDVRAALYTDDEQAVLVISNTGSVNTPRLTWTMRDLPSAWDEAARLSLAACGGEPSIVHRAELQTEGIGLSLGAFSYRFYFIRPHVENAAYVSLDSWPWSERMADGVLEVQGHGPPERSGRLWFRSLSRPSAVHLDGQVVPEEAGWTWQEDRGLGTVRYRCSDWQSILRITFQRERACCRPEQDIHAGGQS